MTTHTTPRSHTIPILLGTAAILALPLVAMLFTDQVAWGPGDFVVAGVLLAGTGLAFDRAAARGPGTAYRAALALALAGALLLVWVNLAVGLIGSEDNPANLMYLAVLGVGLFGADRARLQPRGMARALYATAALQALVGVIAAAAGLGAPENGPGILLVGNGIFVGLFAGSGRLFQHAARERDRRPAA